MDSSLFDRVARRKSQIVKAPGLPPGSPTASLTVQTAGELRTRGVRAAQSRFCRQRWQRCGWAASYWSRPGGSNGAHCSRPTASEAARGRGPYGYDSATRGLIRGGGIRTGRRPIRDPGTDGGKSIGNALPLLRPVNLCRRRPRRPRRCPWRGSGGEVGGFVASVPQQGPQSCDLRFGLGGPCSFPDGRNRCQIVYTMYDI